MIQQFAARFESHFPRALSGLRRVGREAEYPVVWADGSAADVRLLLRELKAMDPAFKSRHEGGFDRLLSSQDTTQLVGMLGDRAEYSLEVGWGTVEVITGPTRTLHELRDRHEAAMEQLLRAAERLGMSVLGCGMQPRTPPSRDLMSPRSRYGAMLEVVGDDWLWFTVTASDQLHVDVARDEMVAVSDTAGLLTPLLVSLCANSAIHSGKPSGFASAREGLMARVQAAHARHGMPRDDFGSAEALVGHLLELPFLMAPAEETGVWRPLRELRPFLAWLEESGGDADSHWPAFLAHEHYVWHSCRPRTKQRTVELRAACQQPWAEHMAAAALGLGLVEAAPALDALVAETFAGDRALAWTEMRAWHRHAVLAGLGPPDGRADRRLSRQLCDAAAAGDSARVAALLRDHRLCETVEQAAEVTLAAARGEEARVRALIGDPPAFDVHAFIARALPVVAEALDARGQGEAEFLAPLERRAEERMAPAQRAMAVAAEEGMAGLVDSLRISV